MSNKANEIYLESLFDELREQHPYLDEDAAIAIASGIMRNVGDEETPGEAVKRLTVEEIESYV